MTEGFTVINGGASQRETFPRCDSTPLAIISIRLEDMEGEGLPPNVVYHSLFQYLPKNIVYIDLPFNLRTSTSQRGYTMRVNELARRLKSGDLKRCVSQILLPNASY